MSTEHTFYAYLEENTVNISHEKNGKVLKVNLEGKMDYDAARELKEYLSDKYKDVWEMVFDLEGLEYTSSAGMRVILENELLMKKRGGLKLINVNEEIIKVFKIAGFDKVLKINE